MKRIVKILVLMLILASFATVSMAADVSLSLSPSKTKVEVGQEVKVAITVRNFTREGIQKAIELKLGYENTKLEIKKVEGKNGWTVTTSSDKTGIVVSKNEEVNSSETVAEITFLVKEDATTGSTNITAQNILTSADGDEIEAANTSATIEIIKKEVTPSDDDNQDVDPNADKDKSKGQEENKSKEGTNDKDSTSKKDYPYTGVEEYIIPIGIVAIFSAGAFIGYRRYKMY